MKNGCKLVLVILPWLIGGITQQSAFAESISNAEEISLDQSLKSLTNITDSPNPSSDIAVIETSKNVTNSILISPANQKLNSSNKLSNLPQNLANSSNSQASVPVESLKISSKASDLESTFEGSQRISQSPEPAKDLSNIPVSPQLTEPEPTFGSSFTILPQISTLGLGLGLATPINGNLVARVGINAAAFGLSLDSDGINYKGNINLFSVSGLVDYYPFGNNSFFALTGGAMYYNNRVGGEATTGVVTVGNTQYDLTGSSLNGRFSYSSNFAPYLGITLGGTTGSKGGLGFFANLGVLFTGQPTADINASGTITTIPSFQADLQREVQSVRDEINNNFPGIYPVLSLGLTYQF